MFLIVLKLNSLLIRNQTLVNSDKTINLEWTNLIARLIILTLYVVDRTQTSLKRTSIVFLSTDTNTIKQVVMHILCLTQNIKTASLMLFMLILLQLLNT